MSYRIPVHNFPPYFKMQFNVTLHLHVYRLSFIPLYFPIKTLYAILTSLMRAIYPAGLTNLLCFYFFNKRPKFAYWLFVVPCWNNVVSRHTNLVQESVTLWFRHKNNNCVLITFISSQFDISNNHYLTVTLHRLTWLTHVSVSTSGWYYHVTCR
jgi:hypothetical protein